MAMAEEDLTPVVIDNGSRMCKAGFAGEDAPRVCFPSIIARPNYQTKFGTANEICFIGEEPLHKKGVYKCNYPIERGIVHSWDDMERIWHHCYFNELRVLPDDHPVLLTEAPMTPKTDREKMTHVMFETFNVPSFFVQIPAVLSLYASGRTNGIVVESGDDMTNAVPVFEGYSLPDSIMKIELAGRDLTAYMMKLLMELGLSLITSVEREIARDIKEKLAYVALDFDAELKAARETSKKKVEYTLPDGMVVTIDDQIFRCPEALFQPTKYGKDYLGIHELVFQSISKCDADLRKDMFSNIILSGGSTMFEGIAERFYKEVKALAPSKIQVKVVAPAERKFSAWIGGSILACVDSFQPQWITKAEYDEIGPAVVHRKCF